MLRRILVISLTALAALFVATGAAQSHRYTPPHYPVAGFLGNDTDQCFFTIDGEHPTADFGAYGENYTERFARTHEKTLSDEGLACVGRSAVRVSGHTEGGGNACNENAPILAPFEDATFADGEEVLVCDIPDIVPGGGGNGVYVPNRGEPFHFDGQGARCEATVMTGPDGSHTRQVATRDSIQLDERFKTLNGKPTAALTTVCVGRLPAGTTVAPSVQSHHFACVQDRLSGSGTVPAFGTSYTFPDRQYEQICETPKANRR